MNRDTQTGKYKVQNWFVKKLTPGEKMTMTAGRMGVMFGIITVALGLIQIGYADRITIINKVNAEAKTIVNNNMFEAKIEALKMGVVKKIEDCERFGRTEADGLITIDNNKAGTLKGEDVFSHGILQYKVKTVKYFVKLRDNKVITSRDALMLAQNAQEARQLTKYALFEIKNGWENWYNCGVKYDIGSKIEMIKSLEK